MVATAIILVVRTRMVLLLLLLLPPLRELRLGIIHPWVPNLDMAGSRAMALTALLVPLLVCPARLLAFLRRRRRRPLVVRLPAVRRLAFPAD